MRSHKRGLLSVLRSDHIPLDRVRCEACSKWCLRSVRGRHVLWRPEARRLGAIILDVRPESGIVLCVGCMRKAFTYGQILPLGKVYDPNEDSSDHEDEVKT